MLLVSGDSISSCQSPEAMLNMYIAMTLLQSKLSVNCDVMLGQLGVILNRLSEVGVIMTQGDHNYFIRYLPYRSLCSNILSKLHNIPTFGPYKSG